MKSFKIILISLFSLWLLTACNDQEKQINQKELINNIISESTVVNDTCSIDDIKGTLYKTKTGQLIMIVDEDSLNQE